MGQMRYGGSRSVKEALCVACARSRRSSCVHEGLFRDPGDDKARVKSSWAVG